MAFFPTEPIIFGLTPLPFLLLISIVLSLIVSLVYKYMTDQTLMRELKKDLKKYQDAMKDARDDAAKTSELSKKAMAVNMKYMKQTMKPMLITMLPFILIFWWLKSVLVDVIVIPLSFWPGHLGWVGTYIIFSMAFTTLFRKLLKVT
jgi:uncharacterized membrane protein (DUF106 family)